MFSSVSDQSSKTDNSIPNRSWPESNGKNGLQFDQRMQNNIIIRTLFWDEGILPSARDVVSVF